MADYDSILKEEKKYEEPVVIKDDGPEPFPWFKINFILLTIVLVISYVAYYYLILTPDKIFLMDMEFVREKYLSLLEPLSPYTLDDNYNLKGNIVLSENSYNMLINKNDDIRLNLERDTNYIDYYSKDNKNYLKISGYDDNYYQISNNDYYSVIKNLGEYFSGGIARDKFIKKVYVNNTVPVVESNLVLNNEDIMEALGVRAFENTYQVLFTFKNNAVTNNVISMKIIVNNLTTGERAVFQYQNNYLTYKDSNNNLKFELEGNKDNFSIKIYRDDTIYGVLSGVRENTNYQYLYQVIEQVYTVTLNISSDSNILTYNLASTIEKEGVTYEQALNISLEPNLDEELSNPVIDDSLDYDSLTEEDKNRFQASLEALVGELRQFIREYQ